MVEDFAFERYVSGDGPARLGHRLRWAGGEVLGKRINVVREAAGRFPDQTAGFAVVGDRLYELVVTPVYVQVEGGEGLLNVFVTGFPVDAVVAMELKQQTGGSDFVFLAGGKPLASTVSPAETSQIALQYRRGETTAT